MTMKYNKTTLVQHQLQGETIKFLFFWGHTENPEKGVTQACFSQWYESPFSVDNHTYQTAEHWMMAQKARLFNNTDIAQQILQATKPGEVKTLGRKVTGFDEQVWQAKRYDIVKTGNLHKFSQHPALKEYLLNTHNRVIVEASPVDTIWGIGLAKDHPHATQPHAWRGLNLLGFALMEVRDLLKQ